MSWLRFFRRRRADAELQQELDGYLVEEIAENLARGLSSEEARRQAKIKLGSPQKVRECLWQQNTNATIDNLRRDLQYALRTLARSPGFAFTAILTLALGIGATTAIFSLVNTVLLRPLPFPEQEQLIWLSQQDHSLPGVAAESLSYPDYFDWRAQNHTLSGIASYLGGRVTLQGDGDSQLLDAQEVSSNFFQLLGVAPMLGRDFRWEDEKPGNRSVMLSYALWQSNFGSARDIAGKTIRMDDHNYTVAGVMPKGFQFPQENPAPALWKSIADGAEGKDPVTSQRGYDALDVIGRLKPGVTVEQAKADLSVIAGNLARQYPDPNKQYYSALVEPELVHMTGDTRPALHVLFGAVTLVLLIVCANVAGLLLARGSRRSAEFALRAAVGASRAAIMRQLLMESVTLSLAGGAAGVALAYALLHASVRLMPLDVPRIEGASIDGRVLLFDLFLSLITGLLFGALPAWRLARSAAAQALREGSRSVAGGRGQNRVHNALVIAQTAIGLVLLVGSGLLIRSFIHILGVDPGFDPKHVMTARVRTSFDRADHDKRYAFYHQLVQRLSALPGVQSASAGWPLPMSTNHGDVAFNIAGRPVAKGDEPSESVNVAMSGYFETMRIPLVSGRFLGEQDGVKGAPTILINQAFARKYFTAQNPLGKYIQLRAPDDPIREIVGIVGDVRQGGLTTSLDPQLYLPYAQAVITDPYLAIRTAGDPLALQGALRAAVRDLDKSAPVYQVSTLEDYISKSVAQPRFQTFLFACFAGIALILATIGLYGLLSYMVVQRTLEIGLRMALGAQRTDVLGLIARRGLALALIGVAAGVVIAVVMTRLLAGMLYGIRPTDPLTFAATAVLFLLVSIVASSIPAYRAARMDPMKTLREQ
jgi:putative ABC transport system permease protein